MKTSGCVSTIVVLGLGLSLGACAHAPSADDGEGVTTSQMTRRLPTADCPAGSVCLYQDASYEGWALEVTDTHGCVNLPTEYNDAVSAMKNNTAYSITVYENADCEAGGGKNLTLNAGYVIPSLSLGGIKDVLNKTADALKIGPGYHMNDIVTSVRIFGVDVTPPPPPPPPAEPPTPPTTTTPTTAPAPAASVGAAGAACSVTKGAEYPLRCENKPSPMFSQPVNNGTEVDYLRSSDSYFLCWAFGDPHQGGNSTWYFTVGDDKHAKGWVPAFIMKTSDQFDADPTAFGLPHCP